MQINIPVIKDLFYRYRYQALISGILLSVIFTFSVILPGKAQSEPEELVDLALIPDRPTLTGEGTVKVNIMAKPRGNSVTAASIYVYVDPELFEPSGEEPAAPGLHMTQLLPNCDGGLSAPCPAKSSFINNLLHFFLAITCTEEGCGLTPTDQNYLMGSLELKPKIGAIGKANLYLLRTQTENPTTQTAAKYYDSDVTGVTSPTTLTVTECDLKYDLDPNGRVDVIDLMLGASHWNRQIGQPEFNGQYDTDMDGDIDIIDIQTIANSWGGTCPQQ
jgi:hypothetical protein